VDIDPAQLRDALRLAADEVPHSLILEGSWWQRQRNAWRLSRLEQPRELGFPELHLGRYAGVPVLYSCVYGAPRAVEPIDLFSRLGARLVVIIGSCGALQPHVRLGDVVLPRRVRIGEGASQYYGGRDWADADEAWVRVARAEVEGRGMSVHEGAFLTTSALFAQSPALIRDWTRRGYLGVDMETSAVFTAAHALGMEAVSLVFAWDELHRGRSFLDALTPEEQRAHEAANSAIYEVALELAVKASRKEEVQVG
jgi:purine-nucleoside phosphorylase